MASAVTKASQVSTAARRDISLSAPDITQAEIDAAVAVLRTPQLSLGPRIPEFERTFTDRLGCRHGVAVNSGTSGLHLVCLAMGLGAGDEVITSPFSFIASSNCVMFVGGKPVFADVDPHTWQIDPARIEAKITPRTRALLIPDIFGNIPDFDPILDIARKHKLRVIEDCCEAIGATYGGRIAGTLGEVGVFGFYPNKQITTGEGGMIVTNDDRIAFLSRSLRSQGRDPDGGWLAHARLGYNFRMPDMLAAIGTQQMRRLDEILAKRARVGAWYTERLADEPRVSLMRVDPRVKLSWFVMVVRLSDDYSQAQRDGIMAQLKERGIATNNYFSPLHLQPFYREAWGYQPGDFPVCEALSARTIALPFHNHLTESDVDYVVSNLRALL
ncbi:MAG: DegT/DnrJ/EryC1/StrS family aminotransferase [Phycisphaerales bacterium]|nr:DegT/DnrJ/EryC1/StrS family aminotransferase [Phycisphaerales bacterium]